jgi:hypothetical protein
MCVCACSRAREREREREITQHVAGVYFHTHGVMTQADEHLKKKRPEVFGGPTRCSMTCFTLDVSLNVLPALVSVFVLLY